MSFHWLTFPLESTAMLVSSLASNHAAVVISAGVHGRLPEIVAD